MQGPREAAGALPCPDTYTGVGSEMGGGWGGQGALHTRMSGDAAAPHLHREMRPRYSDRGARAGGQRVALAGVRRRLGVSARTAGDSIRRPGHDNATLASARAGRRSAEPAGGASWSPACPAIAAAVGRPCRWRCTGRLVRHRSAGAPGPAAVRRRREEACSIIYSLTRCVCAEHDKER